jgi:hypothetical protein
LVFSLMSGPVPFMDTLKRWRRSLVALFVTFHILCVVVYALPKPPTMDETVLEDPEVKTELLTSIETIHNVFPWRETAEEQLKDMFAFVHGYLEATDRARKLVTPYLRLIDSTQSWHMFGGTPPRFPLVLMVEVRTTKESNYVVYQDLNWGTSESAAMNFRHRKVHEYLAWSAGSSLFDAYARYWARRWDEEFPDRPAVSVRLSFTRLTTPSPRQVRDGNADRRPEPGRQAHVWVKP